MAQRLPIYSVLLTLLLLSIPGLGEEQTAALLSPDKRLKVLVSTSQGGQLQYQAWYDKKVVLEPSSLGYEFKGLPLLGQGCRIERVQRRQVAETWKPLWGQRDSISNNFNEAKYFIIHESTKAPKMTLVVRAFDDGLAFRTHITAEDAEKAYELMSEDTYFNFPANHQAWWIPDNWDTYESVYSHTPITDIGKSPHPLNPSHTHGAERGDYPHGCNTPVTLSTDDGLFLAIHEADLTDYAGMTLIPVSDERPSLKSQLVPWPDGVKVRGKGDFVTPWRTVQVGDSLSDLVESSLILNLNEPNKLSDVSDVKPMKLLGVWWSMHLGAETWGKEGGRHGATTENVKRYIDFAAANNFDGVLVEGWNTGWESWYKDDNFDFTTPYDDFDLPGLVQYAKSKGVELVGHLETGGQIESFEKRLGPALDQYKKYGVTSVKTGYAGKIRPEGQYHHGQWMVRHYRKVLKEAAERGITVNAHEPIKDTGLSRTYPNMMTREGVRGMEWNAWSRGNPPEHTVNLAFTRLLSGPADYTPGIFDIRFEKTGDEYRLWNKIDGLETKGRLHSTLARQLALFVVLYSPIQMASDLPQNYQGHPAFQFLRDMPVDWNQSKLVAGQLGDYAVTARRHGNDWWIGAITDEEEREVEISLDFLEAGKSYLLKSCLDGEKAHFETSPTSYEISESTLEGGDSLKIRMAPGGGALIQIKSMD